MDATILDTSLKEALGFWPLMAACVSLKNRAYADTGFPFLTPPPAPPALPPGARVVEEEVLEEDEEGSRETPPGVMDREAGDSTRTP